jgi:serine O-acetyltransferase|tara:strand:- start:5790 stop:6605 length:816 start_codon:yes stop_codon:yes gene_type:complete
MANLNLASETNADQCVWSLMKQEAATYAVKETALSSFLHATILDQASLDGAMVNHLSEKLSTADFSTLKLRQVLSEAISTDSTLIDYAAKDLIAVKERDPACHSYLQCFLYFKGYMAIQTHRFAHALYISGRDLLAFHLQNRSSEMFGVDINPAAVIGHGIMLDHATGFVMGETARIGNDCSILQGVTLGGTGKSDEDRHPKVGDRVLVGANASILGNIRIGNGAKIAAGSVVLKAVEDNCTVAGVPAKPVGGPCCGNPAQTMDQTLGDEK